jgi:hypothetical protein
MIIDPNIPLVPTQISIESILQNHAQGLNHFKAHIEALIRKMNELDTRIREVKTWQDERDKFAMPQFSISETQK